MEAEQLNLIANTLADLAHAHARAAEVSLTST